MISSMVSRMFTGKDPGRVAGRAAFVMCEKPNPKVLACGCIFKCSDLWTVHYGSHRESREQSVQDFTRLCLGGVLGQHMTIIAYVMRTLKR